MSLALFFRREFTVGDKACDFVPFSMQLAGAWAREEGRICLLWHAALVRCNAGWTVKVS